MFVLKDKAGDIFVIYVIVYKSDKKTKTENARKPEYHQTYTLMLKC